MKFSTQFVDFFLLVLWISGIQADISLTLRQYPSPPIKEDFYTNQRQQNSAENNNGNTQYQVFQHHNHYDVSGASGGRGNRQRALDKELAYAQNNYTPLRKSSPEVIHIEHINAPRDFPTDDPNLDASYLGFALENDDTQQQLIVQHENKNHIPVPFPSNFHHIFPETSNRPQSYSAIQQFRSENTAAFKGSDYLPPNRQVQQLFTPQMQNSLKPQSYQENQQQNRLAGFEHTAYNNNNVFKGPDYLPPQQDISVSEQHSRNLNGPDNLSPNQYDALKVQRSIASNSGFKGSDYLPPQQQLPIQNNNNFKQSLSDNMKDNERSNQQQLKTLEQPPLTQSFDNSLPQSQYKGPDYLPPRPGNTQYQQNQFTLSQQFNGADNSPPFNVPSPYLGHKISEKNPSFQGPDYLPPQNEENSQYQKTKFIPSQEYNENAPLLGQIATDKKSLFHAPDYLPPQNEGKLANNALKGSVNLISGNTPAVNLGQANLPFRHEGRQTNNPFKGPDYLPPQNDDKLANNAFKGSNNLIPESTPAVNHGQKTLSQNTSPFRQEGRQTNNGFKGPDYLPPTNTQHPDKSSLLQLSDYSSPLQEVKPPNFSFKAPDYLPPEKSLAVNPNKETTNQLLHAGKPALNGFKGPDYLPPQQPQNDMPFKGPDYLPPVGSQTGPQQEHIHHLPAGYDFIRPPDAEQAIEELHKLPENSIESTNPNYAPPEKLESYSKNGIFDFKKPENSEQAIRLLHSQDTRFSSKERSLPVYHFQGISNSESMQNQLQNALTSNLPRGYDMQRSYINSQRNTFENNQQQLTLDNQAHQLAALQQMQIQSNQAVAQARFKGPDYLPPSRDSQSFNEYQTPSQAFKGPDYLPPSSETGAFNAGSSMKYFDNSQFLPTNPGTQNYKGPEYLPPISSQVTVTEPQVNQFKGSDNKQPNVDQQFKAPDYLPPLVTKTVQMYPLSSFMTNLKPNERYGSSRRPFPEYGLPPAKSNSFPTINEIAPMYRQPELRPQYYAPTMSYAKNALSGQITSTLTTQQQQTSTTLNQQARQVLQTFMPQDIRQTTPKTQLSVTTEASGTKTSLQAPKSAKAKIRTVQIVNTNRVKTLKVLESLDDAGVKTLKILGSSNESPMGDHRIIKVVSGNQHQSVQTVKIFNDHQDVTTDESAGSAGQADKNYLPPRNKRNSKNVHKKKLHQHVC